MILGGGASPPCSFQGESWISVHPVTAKRFLRLTRYKHQIRGGRIAAIRWALLPVKRPNHQAGRYVPARCGVELGFVERLDGKIVVLQRCTDGLRGAVYLHLNILTYMASET